MTNQDSAVFIPLLGLIGLASGKWTTLGRLNEILSALLVSFCARIASGTTLNMIRLTTENSSLFTQHTFLDFAFRQSIFPLFAGSSLVRAIVWS